MTETGDKHGGPKHHYIVIINPRKNKDHVKDCMIFGSDVERNAFDRSMNYALEWSDNMEEDEIFVVKPSVKRPMMWRVIDGEITEMERKDLPIVKRNLDQYYNGVEENGGNE
tara:strand:- start:116 stop:451 length:336 start_codon:yes stop_codon:yes gene_type:complete